MQSTRPRTRLLALSLPLLLSLPSCEAVVAAVEAHGVTSEGQVHENGLECRWSDFDVWSDGTTVSYKGQLEVKADAASAAYVIVLRIGSWAHSIEAGPGGKSSMHAVEGSVQVPDASVLAVRPAEVHLSGHLDSMQNALQGKSQCFRTGIGVLRRTDPVPTTK